ncbi:MAG: phosphoadenylyl-sulfate reductase [Candidatus Hydrogenedentota bacterium]|nr:MAG: phosphoadenylyl-sulfate reductase [Candidatus Hydrogenedentota bacterium]GIX44110.1 MAG: phosphoadenosine phosphosulfate reductase [Candidatus Sumerlaea sp.]
MLKELDLTTLNTALSTASPQEVIRWAVDTFGARLAMQSSMQKTACALMHMAAEICPEIEIIFVDTGVHFPETLALRDEYQQRFHLNIRTVAPKLTWEEQFAKYGRHLYLYDDEFDPPGYRECCRLRKEIPFLEAVQGRFDAVIGGLMRAEGGTRSRIDVVSPDPRLPGYKIYPLAHWSEEQVDAYIREHDLPVHPLYAHGYASIGCHTCTTPIREGEPKRAGRWRHIREAHPERYKDGLYCGINLEDRRPRGS